MLDGKPIIILPPKTIALMKVDFSEEERTFYTRLEAESREQFKVSVLAFLNAIRYFFTFASLIFIKVVFYGS